MKILFISVALLLGCPNLLAQGTVDFSNNNASAVSNRLTGLRIPAGTIFKAALYYLPETGGQPTTSDFDQAGFPCAPWADFSSPGLFASGERTTPTNTAAGDWAWFQVRAWETEYGASYEEAKAAPPKYPAAASTKTASATFATSFRRALIGTSNILRVRTGGIFGLQAGGAVQSYPHPPGSLTNSGLQSFVLVPVPLQPTINGFRVDPVITFDTFVGLTYAVDKNTGLNSTNWQPLPGASNIVGTGGPVFVSDPGAGCVHEGYYRVRLVE